MVLNPIPRYSPDIAVVNSEYSDTIINVLPSASSYVPMPSFLPITVPIPESRALSAIGLRKGRLVRIFIGTERDIFSYDRDTLGWKKLTPGGVQYNATVEEPWSFEIFGKLLIAVNIHDKPQCLDLSDDDAIFRDLGGNPPKAGGVASWGDFLCLMRLADHPNRVHWSALNNAEKWEPGQDSCDYQEFPDGDYVQGSSSATDPVIFMRTCIYKGSFVPGSGLVFSFKKIHADRGVKSFGSIAIRGNFIFFLDDSGFHQMASDGTVISIGAQRVDRTIFAKFGDDILEGIRGVVDPVYNRVYWSIRPSSGTQLILVYDWHLQQWTTIYTDPMRLLPLYSTGYTLDELDKVTLNIDHLALSLDNKLWQDGAPLLAAVDLNNRLGYFAGESMEAIIRTSEMGLSDGRVSFVSSVFAEVDTSDAILKVGTRFIRDLSYPVKWSRDYYSSYHTGCFGVRSRSRYHTFEFRIPSGTKWSHFTGYDVTLKPSGRR